MTTLLADETNRHVRFHLMTDVSMHMHVYGDKVFSLAWATRLCEEFDREPFAWARMASWYRFGVPGEPVPPEDMEKAVDCYLIALQRARAANEWVRDMLGDICRLPMDMEDYPRLEVTMQEILEDVRNRRRYDFPKFEGEWLKRIPEGAIDPDLLARFWRFVMADWMRRRRTGFTLRSPMLRDLDRRLPLELRRFWPRRRRPLPRRSLDQWRRRLRR